MFDKNGRYTFWNFFGRLLKYTDIIRVKKPGEIAEKIKKDNVAIPKVLNDKSVVYLISALKEGLTIDN